MQKIPYIPPKFKQTAFNCPLCNAYASQSWFDAAYFNAGYHLFDSMDVCFCSHCREFSIWFYSKMIYPNFAGIEPPNQDLSENIQNDYQEAAEILQRSPRGAAALLRLAIQKLCIQLGEKGVDLNTDIGNLVKKGLPEKVQQSLDTLRVIGAQAVHPGQIELKDDVETASALFRLVNFIAEKLITEPNEIDEIYSKIPDGKKEQIVKRDTVKKT
jgi:hypothetical protein